MGLKLRKILKDDWIGVRQNFDKIKTHLLGPAATVSHAGLTLSDLTGGRVIYAGAGGTLSDDGSLLWNNSTKILTTTGLTVTGCSVLGLNSAVFQPTTDSTTFGRFNDKDGNVIVNVDTVNNIFGAKVGRSTTFVIAASNSSATAIAQADYVCDGTDDHVEVNNAIAALSNSGGVIKLLEGTYVMGGTIPVPDNVSILGSDSGTLVNFDVVQDKGFRNDDLTNGNHNIIIAGMKIDGMNKTNDPIEFRGGSYNCRFMNLELTRGNHDGIELSTCHDCIISNVIVHDSNTYHGIELDGDSYNNIVSNCIVYNNPADGIVLNVTSHDNLITGCISRDNTGYGIAMYASTFDNFAIGNLTEGNTVSPSFDSGTNNLLVSEKYGMFGLGCNPVYKLSIGSTDRSDQIGIYHDNNNARMTWTDGRLYFITAEGTNENTILEINGKGTGYGYLIVRDEDDAEYIRLRCMGGLGKVDVGGTSPVALVLQENAVVPVRMFSGTAEGRTQELQLSGFGSGSGGKETLAVSVEKYAANTSEFFGTDAYMFQGNLITLNNIHSDAGGARVTSHDFKGEQSGGEQTTLARIEAGHDGSADDEKGYLDTFINDGDDGDSPTHMMRVNSVGVGIGTTNPQQLLHLSADNATMNEAIRLQNTGSSVGDEIGIYFRHYTDGKLQAFIKDEILSGWPTKLHFGTAAGENNAATKMTIDGSGKVGIGTANPSQKLNIVAGNGGVLISYAGEGIGVAKSLYFGRGGGTWMPIVWGVGGATGDAGLWLLAETEVADDSGTEPLIRLDARQSDSSPITTRPILTIENNESQLVIVDKDGNVDITGAVTGTSFITAGNIGVVADTDLLQLAANTLTVNGTITLPSANKINFRDSDISIGSPFDGKLDINADVSVGFFYDNADVGDEVDGQSVYINRRAGEGDDYIRLYVDKDRKGLIGFSGADDLLQLAVGALTVNGNIAIGGSNNELRFYEGVNYVGFEAPALSADQIWVLPTADGNADEIIKTDGAGALSFVRMSKAIYAELSDSTDQTFAATGTAYSIMFDTNDEIAGITHSTSVNPENITIDTAGVYTIFAQPQVAAAAGGAGVFHMWLQKDTGGGFADIANTNIELSLASLEEDVIPLATTFMLSAGDIIRLRASVSDTKIKLDAQIPASEPAIPSIIFTMFMIGT